MTKLLNKFKIHPLTLFFLLIGCLSGYGKYQLYIFGIVLIHELGHIFFMLTLKRKITSVTILPFGGLTKTDSLISAPILEDLLISVGGIFFQTLLGFLLMFLNYKGHIDPNTFTFLNTYNMTILVFNLIPASPLDGSKIAKNLSELFIPFKYTFTISLIISILSLIFIVFHDYEILLSNPFVFAFIIFMILEEKNNEKYIYNRFLIERLTHDFPYKIKRIKNHYHMYKNHIHIIDNKPEKDYLKHLFTPK